MFYLFENLDTNESFVIRAKDDNEAYNKAFEITNFELIDMYGVVIDIEELKDLDYENYYDNGKLIKI